MQKINENIRSVCKHIHIQKMISGGENNFTQNTCNKWIKNRNVYYQNT